MRQKAQKVIFYTLFLDRERKSAFSSLKKIEQKRKNEWLRDQDITIFAAT
jgi:hypothetical protein